MKDTTCVRLTSSLTTRGMKAATKELAQSPVPSCVVRSIPRSAGARPASSWSAKVPPAARAEERPTAPSRRWDRAHAAPSRLVARRTESMCSADGEDAHPSGPGRSIGVKAVRNDGRGSE